MFITNIILTFLQIEQSTVDVVLNEDEEYLIEVVGKKWVLRFV